MEKLNQSRFSTIIEIPQLCLRGMIRVYAYCISPLFPSSCRFQPTCSSYAHEALQVHGAIRGSVLILKRIGKCHPWGGHGIDCVPKQKRLKA